MLSVTLRLANEDASRIARVLNELDRLSPEEVSNLPDHLHQTILAIGRDNLSQMAGAFIIAVRANK